MKSIYGILAFLVSFSSFGAIISCKVEVYADDVHIEKLEIEEVEVTNNGGGAQVLFTSDKRFMFEMGATYKEYTDTRFRSTSLAIHVTDLKHKTTNSLIASFNKTENHFRFDGGDHNGAKTYVGICSVKY